MSTGKNPFKNPQIHSFLDNKSVNLLSKPGTHYDKTIYGQNKDDFHSTVVEEGME